MTELFSSNLQLPKVFQWYRKDPDFANVVPDPAVRSVCFGGKEYFGQKSVVEFPFGRNLRKES